jgi:hypothetical protein
MSIRQRGCTGARCSPAPRGRRAANFWSAVPPRRREARHERRAADASLHPRRAVALPRPARARSARGFGRTGRTLHGEPTLRRPDASVGRAASTRGGVATASVRIGVVGTSAGDGGGAADVDAGPTAVGVASATSLVGAADRPRAVCPGPSLAGPRSRCANRASVFCCRSACRALVLRCWSVGRALVFCWSVGRAEAGQCCCGRCTAPFGCCRAERPCRRSGALATHRSSCGRRPACARHRQGAEPGTSGTGAGALVACGRRGFA